jgi:tetratricopeptide (TPR) repeat protein
LVADFKQIHEWVKHPEALTSEDIAVLDDLCSQYPWSAPLQVLRAKAHKNANRFTFKSHLQKAAMLVGDREVLYGIIQGPAQLDVEEKVAEIQVENPSQQDAAEVSPETQIEIEATEPIEHSETAKEIPEVVDTKVEPTERTEEETLSKETSDGDHTEDVLKTLALESPIYDPEKELMNLLEKEKEAKEEEIVEDKELDFTTWLDELDEDIQEEEEAKNPAVPIDKDAHELLAQFLEKRNKAREVKVERKPVEPEPHLEEEDLVSESLASLYVKQGHYKEAIKAYEKLSLQNPSKNAYFADLIEEIKNKQKET